MHYNGLSDREVAESRKKYGSNVIPDSEPTTFWAEFKETFGDPMIRILLAIAVLMIVMCAFGYADIYEPIGTIVAILIVAFVSAKTNALITESSIAPSPDSILRLALAATGVIEFTLFVSI